MTMNRACAAVPLMTALLIACSDPQPRPRVNPTSVSPSPPAPRTVRFAAVGDIGDGSSAEARVAATIAGVHRRDPIDLLLLLGDLIYPRGNPLQYRTKFQRPYRPVIRTGVEIDAVLGNHDIQTDTEAVRKLFRMPARYYTFIRGHVQFFALDSNPSRILAPERAWLRRQLARSRARWKIAFMHVPPFSSGMHGSNATLQNAFVDLFERYDVDLVLAGHDHDYERTRPIRGVTYVVSGGGCCPRRVGRSTFTASASSALHFVIIEASADDLTIEALGADGRVFDRATLARKRAAA
jgi:3',5'-cyclic AMP phosphodiesterase CpdA